MKSKENVGYTIKKPATSYRTEQECPWKFYNGEEVGLVVAVDEIVKNKESFTAPNADLLTYAVKGTPWGV